MVIINNIINNNINNNNYYHGGKIHVQGVNEQRSVVDTCKYPPTCTNT